MHKNIYATLAALILALPCYGQQTNTQSTSPSLEVARAHAELDEHDLQSHRHYHNKRGVEVHAPAASKSGKVPDGASAQCRDGTYSFSHSRRGTCSHHGGVATWL
jgi:hypothetical protein